MKCYASVLNLVLLTNNFVILKLDIILISTVLKINVLRYYYYRRIFLSWHVKIKIFFFFRVFSSKIV